MIRSPARLNPPPPRLSMNEYADFVEASLRDVDVVRVARQKGLEERVRMPFRIKEDNTGCEERKKDGL